MAGGVKIYSLFLSALVACQLCQVASGLGGFSVANETALRNSLLATYDRDVRPDATTIIQLQLHVTAITIVDIKNEIFSLSGWWSMVWTDSRLNWQSQSDIPVVQFFEDKIWSPVLVVSNSIKDLTAIDEDSIPLRADAGGKVVWSPPALLDVSCTMDVTYFPFDVQTCSIEVTSFGYTMQELDIKVYSDGLSFTYYQPSGEWDILSYGSDRSVYSEDGYDFARVTFDMKISRKPLYYGVNLILPLVVNAALTLFVFLLPPESGEKIGYCLTVLLAFMVILTLVSTELPTTATNTPILEIYIAIVLVLGGLSVVLAILVLHVYFLPEEKPVPEWVKAFSLRTMQIFFISRVKPPTVTGTGGINTNKKRDGSPVSASDVHTQQQDHNTSSSYLESEVTWQIVASTIDGFFFRLYALCFLLTTVIIMVVLSTSN